MRNLITAQEVIELAFAENSNMREESISATSIHIAEIKYIRPAFGDMYALLSDKYADFTNDYVKPALAYFVKCEIVSSIAIDMSNSGIAVANPQYQSAASDKQRQRLYDSEMSKAKALLDFALEYIATHSEEFPDFRGNAPKKHHRVGGLVLGDGASVKTSSIAGEAFKGEIEKLNTRVDDLEERIDDIGGGGNSDNNYTDADKALVQTIPSKLDRSEFEEFEGETAETLVSITQGIEGIGQDVETKADKDGYYPDMTVGKADNLVGRGDVQDAQINFRPSAGADNITDGAARIERIKGNSVVYNQLVNEPLFGSLKDYNSLSGATFVKGTDGAVITLGAAENTGVTYGLIYSSAILNHKYYVEVVARAETPISNVAIPYTQTMSASQKATIGTDYQKYGVIHTHTATAGFSCGILRVAGLGTNFVGGEKIYVKSFRIIDLTQMFGDEVAKTISTIEQYNERKPMNIEDEYEHNAGELVDMKVDSLISTSDNAYDYTKHYARVMGGYQYDITANAGATLVVSFYADGEDTAEEREIAPDSEGKYTFPANGICYVNGDFASERDVCVCLNHSYTKPHPPYQQNVKDLSFIGEAFPEGMRSAGSAYDEIRFNPTKKEWEAVKRIGELKLADIPKSKWATVKFNGYDAFRAQRLDINAATDLNNNSNALMNIYVKGNLEIYQSGLNKAFELNHGYYGSATTTPFLAIRDTDYADIDSLVASFEQNNATLYYELAEPVVEPIDLSPNFNPDYLVWDFGTEEAIASVPSAPFRADINYEPNAVDDLRWCISHVREIKEWIEANKTQTTNIE